ncbi:MAG: DUF1080 domain-containing protein, partial [Bacteroidales bacterium]|nr:DUF1080 domain-containing protein [Bacteroidales bacterium]
MKKTFLFLVSLALITSACTSEEKIELFNGENLDNWNVFLPDTIESETVFTVKEGLILVGGMPFGYISTKEEYSSYKLHVEWRWTEEPKNSGVLLHVSGEDMIWPNCIEAQLMSGNAGDLVLIGKGVGLTVNDTAHVIESEENRYAVLPKNEDSSENPPGEWNTYDITVSETSIELMVNNVHQNTGLKPTKTKGKIGIQSEGGPMEFRNIYL